MTQTSTATIDDRRLSRRSILLAAPATALGALLAGAASRPANAAPGDEPGPLEVAWAFAEAENAHDLEAIVALFAEDAVITNPAGTYRGREEIRELYRATIAANIHAVAREFRVTGIRVTFISAATSDQIGDVPLDLHITGLVRDGLIQRWTVAPAREKSVRTQNR